MIASINNIPQLQVITAKKEQITVLQARISAAVQQNEVLENSNAELQRSITLVNSNSQIRLSEQNAIITNLRAQIAVAQQQKIARAQLALVPKPLDPKPIWPEQWWGGMFSGLSYDVDKVTIEFYNTGQFNLLGKQPRYNESYIHIDLLSKEEIDMMITSFKNGHMKFDHPDYYIVYCTYLGHNLPPLNQISRFG